MRTFILEGVDPRLFNVYASLLAEVLMMVTGFVLSELYRFMLSIYLKKPGNSVKLQSLGRLPADLFESIKVTAQASDRFWKCWPAVLITILFLSDHATTVAFAGLDFTEVEKAGPNATVLNLQRRNAEFPYGVVGDPTNPRTISQLEAVLQGTYDPLIVDDDTATLTNGDLQSLVQYEAATNTFLAAADAIARGESVFLTEQQRLDPYVLTLGANYLQEQQQQDNTTISVDRSALMTDATSLFVQDSFLVAMDLEIPLECNSGQDDMKNNDENPAIPPLLRFPETRGVLGDFQATSAVPDCSFTSTRASSVFRADQPPQVQVTAYQSYRQQIDDNDDAVNPENARLDLLPAGSNEGVQFQTDDDNFNDPAVFDFPSAGSRLARDRVDFRKGRTVGGFGGVRIRKSQSTSDLADSELLIPFGRTMFASGGVSGQGKTDSFLGRDTVLLSYVDDKEACGKDPSGATDTSCFVVTSMRCGMALVEGNSQYWEMSNRCDQIQQVEMIWGRGVEFDEQLLVAIAGTYGRNLKHSDTLQAKRSLAMHSLLAATFSLASLEYQPSIALSRSTTINTLFLAFMAVPVVLCLVAGAIRIVGNRQVVPLPDDGMKMWLLANSNDSRQVSSLDLRRGDEAPNTHETENLKDNELFEKASERVILSFNHMSSTLVVDESSDDSDEDETGASTRSIKPSRGSFSDLDRQSNNSGVCGFTPELRGVIVSMIFCALLAWVAGLAVSSKSIESEDALKPVLALKFGERVIEPNETYEPVTNVSQVCFSDSVELEKAIEIFFEGTNESKTELFDTYGLINDWCTNSLEDFSLLFHNRDLEGVDLSNWNVTSGILFESTFAGATNLNTSLSSWETKKAQSFRGMFAHAGGAVHLNFSLWYTLSVKDFSFFLNDFYIDRTLTETEILDFSNWDTAEARNMNAMFANFGGYFKSDNIRLVGFSNWDTAKARNMNNMFSSCRGFNDDLSLWSVGRVTHFTGIFYGTPLFNSNLSAWDTSNAVKMNSMFANAESFNSDLSNWKVDNCVDLSGMFFNTPNFESDLSSWNVGKNKDFESMFNGASNFNSDLSMWSTSKGETFGRMFAGAQRFNSSLDNWDVSRSTSFSRMFRGASAFESDLSRWRVDKGLYFSEMFYEASHFSSDLSSWNMSSAQSITRMFHEASQFSSNLCSWREYNRVDSLLQSSYSRDGLFEGTRCPRQEVTDLFFCELCEETEAPSASPSASMAPSFAPSVSQAPSSICALRRENHGGLSTGLIGNRGGSGNLFTVKAKTDVWIVSLDIHTRSTSTVSVIVWTRRGPYPDIEGDTTGWSRLWEQEVLGQGGGRPTPLDCFATPVQIPANVSQSFYVSILSLDYFGFRYTLGSDVGGVWAENNDLVFYQGHGVGGFPLAKFFPERVFNGEIHYTLDAESAGLSSDDGYIVPPPFVPSSPLSNITIQYQHTAYPTESSLVIVEPGVQEDRAVWNAGYITGPYTYSLTLMAGNYSLIVSDSYGDGLAPSGFVSLSVNSQEIWRLEHTQVGFFSQQTFDFQVL